ncbi:MAG: hypothetical protein H0W86_08395 [Armatimonadetes bacterium]|nr:hypothetical protein [Armatimonadota bacterium]
MKHYTSPDSWALFNQLSEEVQALARANFELLKADPRHPSLHFKKAAAYWSARVGLNYRVLGKEVEGGILWGWIGSHSEYERQLR